MTDIVERLRWSGQDAMTKHLSLGMATLHAEAADEIERLRARYHRTTDQAVTYADEIIRLRDLLQELIDIEGPQPGTNEWANKVRRALLIQPRHQKRERRHDQEEPSDPQ